MFNYKFDSNGQQRHEDMPLGPSYLAREGYNFRGQDTNGFEIYMEHCRSIIFVGQTWEPTLRL